MLNRHKVQIESVEKKQDNTYWVRVKGYDAEKENHFDDYIQYYVGDVLRGTLIDPRNQYCVSTGCKVFIKTVVLREMRRHLFKQ